MTETREAPHWMLEIGARAEERAAQYDDPHLAGFVRGLAIQAGFTSWTNRQATETYAYHCYEDLVLAHGTVTKQRLFVPEDYWGDYQVGQCYAQAYELAVEHPELTYCEGYAQASVIPVPHAWVIDPDGVVIDPTWAESANIAEVDSTPIYCGLRFDTTYLLANAVRCGWVSVLASDWQDDCYHLRRGFIFDDNGLVIGDLPDLTERRDA